MRILTIILFILLLTFSIGTRYTANGQTMNLSEDAWAKKLSDPNDIKNVAAESLFLSLAKSDSAKAYHFLDKLGAQSSVKGHYFIARYNCLKSMIIRNFNPPKPLFSTFIKESIKDQITGLLEEAMQQAYIVDDDYLAAYVSSIYGKAMSDFGNTEKGVMYMMYSAESYDKVHLLGNVGNYIVLGETLWRVREYKKAIYYTKIAITLLMESHRKYKTRYIAMCNNTLGLAFHRIGEYDSAFFYYQKGLQFVAAATDKGFRYSWEGTISGNLAQIDFVQGKYTTALPLFMMDYQRSKENKYYADAANSLQWAAKTNLALGNKAEALRQVRESFNLLNKWPNAANYRQNAYLTASEIFKALGNNDSAYYYSNTYNLLHDSLERVIYLSGINISQLRLNNEKNRYNIQNLQREKNAQLQQRNMVIAGILLLSIIILLLINRQRQKFKFKGEMHQREKMQMEEKMESAKAQLKLFTKSIIEKTSLIEKLEQQVQNNIMTQQELELIEELSHQTILTEDDWLNFKNLFGKIYPHFFEKIIKRINNITQAEQRMAALTILHLTTKQMAAVLGISPNSVIKAKQRLRQRFNLETDQQVEEFVGRL